MRSIIILFSVFLLGVSGYSQNIEIKGRIIDTETNNPVEFANVGVVGHYLGTASDFNGNFILTVGQEFVESKVIISAVGYLSKEISVAQLEKSYGADIKLFPKMYGIDQVEVKADSRRLYGILKTASNIIEDYYSDGYSASVYMSQTVNGSEKTEAVIDFADINGYGERSFVNSYESRQYEVIEVRRNYEVSPIKKGMIYAGIIQDFDIVRQRGNVLDNEFVNKYSLSLKDELAVDGDSVWVIQYVLNEPDLATTGDAYCAKYEGHIYVRQDDFVIVRNELEFISKGFSHAGRDAYRQVDANTPEYECRVVTNYKKTEGGKYALSKISYSGKSTRNSLDIEWVVYKTDKNFKDGVNKTFYSDKSTNKEFWERFSLPVN